MTEAGGLIADLRVGVRMLLKRPGTTALAVIALALGIGLTTTMFSIVHGVLLRGLPFERADRIVYAGVASTRQAGERRPGAVATRDFEMLRSAQQSLEGLGGYSRLRADLIGDDGVPYRYDAARLTANTFSLLRVAPIRGRAFTDGDAQADAGPVALIGESVWATQFQRAEDVVGKVVRLNGEQATIVGVMPAHFGFPERELVWVPYNFHAPGIGGTDGTSHVEAFGRLREGVSLGEASAELAAMAGRLAPLKDPEASAQRTLLAVPFIRRFLRGDIYQTFYTMLAAVFGVLLIACVNVTNLQLARAADRAREIAIRLALGASRTRVIRMLLAEGLLLAGTGAAIGLGIALVGTTLVQRGIADTGAPFWISFDLDVVVLTFVVALTVLATLASSLVPALRATGSGVGHALKDEGRGSTSLRIGRFSRGLVVAQISLSFGLLLASGLMIKSIVKSNFVAFPFRTEPLIARLDFTGKTYADPAVVRSTLRRIHERVTSVSGVSSAAYSSSLPGLGGAQFATLLEGEPLPRENEERRVEAMPVSPHFFAVMGVNATRGRLFTDADRADAEPVVLVSEPFVQQYLGGRDPVGVRLRFFRDEKTPKWRTIVGVVPAFPGFSRTNRIHTTVLAPIEQWNVRGADIIVSSMTDPLALATPVRRAIAEIDPAIAVHRVTTVKGRFDEQTWPFRVFGGLFSAFGAAALLLASAGLYGVMAFNVRRRTPEIGIRMALGADRVNILRMVLRQGIWLLGIGVALGAGLGYFLSSQLGQLLFQVSATDASVFGVTFGVLSGAGLIALLVPARRASAVDPLAALRAD